MTNTRRSAITLSHHRRRGSLSAALILGLLAFAVPLLLAPGAGAAAPDFVLQIPEGKETPGSGAGELSNPRGIAADPITGHVYISEHANSRISEFTAWGSFVKAWGWDVAPEGAPGDTPSDQLEVCTTTCKEGTAGDGPGQGGGFGVTLDANGDIYVYQDNERVQKFDPAGSFLLMFGGEVNKTSGAEVCTKADLEGGDVCGAGVPGTGPGEFSTSSVNTYITYNPATDTIFVGDKDRIQEFETDGSFKAQIPFEGALEAFAGQSVSGLDSDEAGNLYLALTNTEDLYKLSPSGEPLAPGKPGESGFKVGDPAGVAVDVEGNVYAIDKPGGTSSDRVVEFDPAAKKLLPTKAEEEAAKLTEGTGAVFFPYIAFQGPKLTGLGTNICAGSDAPGNLYVVFGFSFSPPPVSKVNAYGTGPVGCEDPPMVAPEIVEQYATAVSRDDATLKAEINPRFWDDATYFVEYGTGKCSEGGCDKIEPSPEALLTSKVVNRPVRTAGVFLDGLQPGTEYHYRFVSSSGGGGPSVGEERSFRTFAAPAPPPACANDVFRNGPGAELPDCRAYEMVSPLEKGNADVALWMGRNALEPSLFEINQSAASGERFTYSSQIAFADPEAAPFSSQYLAERSGGGWASESISPPSTQTAVEGTAFLSGNFQGFSDDLCSAWLRSLSVAPLAVGAIEKYSNLYRRDNCSEPAGYEALSTAKPLNRTAAKYLYQHVQGSSQDGTHSIFLASGELVEDAPALDQTDQLLYEHTPEGVRFVCYLPNGDPTSQPCEAGMSAGTVRSSVRNAISADGSRIFWSTYSGGVAGGVRPQSPGPLFVRINGAETLRVSGTISPDPASYWTADDDGTKAIFAFESGARKGELYEFDVEKALAEEPGAARLIAKGVEGPMGASEDASRIYFASTEDLDGGGEGSAGAHNLYFYEAGEGGGSFTFIMALNANEMNGFETYPAPIDVVPAQRAARVSADGLHAAFISAASPTPSGYDNRDVLSGEPAQEVYLYDAAQDELLCVSCNPTGARPAVEPPALGVALAAARIQAWEVLQHAPRVLSDDGSRVFFESFEALVAEDTNGTWDVYQWEEPGKGSCSEADPTFGEASGGCVDLISSGKSPARSVFLDADPSGNNAFFGTRSSLVGADYGLNDVYVARIGGGFPEARRRGACEGESCQSPSSAPLEATPASAVFKGPGNARKRKALRCRAGKRKVRRGGKARCVKRGSQKTKKRANAKRRAGR